ncbi:hypothetical protein GH714_009426 [Hevea brasiliensis]|uniref:Auxin-responsive protein n=1 Tax=Hevea brasiliensis TaxID=3981 RepID=A0A6A6NGA0_HEVBR|nr:hypothetical protein GH714_009426 [Hevea brasiliensis]
MSSPLLGVVEEECKSNVTLLASSISAESICPNSSELKERNYMGLSDCSSVDSSVVPAASDESKTRVNLKATELRLGLPGSQSPERNSELCLLSSAQLDEKPFFPLHPLMMVTALQHRKMWFRVTKEGSLMLWMDSQRAQVVGWPPIRSFRKNSLATTSKILKKWMEKQVNMDLMELWERGAKRDQAEGSSSWLRICFLPTRIKMVTGCLLVMFHGRYLCVLIQSVYLRMFVETCKRLRIMKSSDAIGLAPRAVEKCKNRN